MGEVVVTLVVAKAAKVALGMVFDSLEKALRDAAARRHANVRIEVRNGGSGEIRQVPITGVVIDKAISLAVKTAKSVVDSWL
jgi:hypothetical protein